MMLKILFFFISLLLVSIPSTQVAKAADVRAGDNVVVDTQEKPLNNPYLFGDKISISVPVQNDLVTAGGNIALEGDVNGSIWAAGGDVNIKSTVGNSVRVAGGNITIDGVITEDLIVMGGSVEVTKNASIGGDLIFFGGQLELDAPVGGSVQANGGDITLNSEIKGSVNGEMGRLIVGDNAQIEGNLTYTADNPTRIDNNQVAGKITYQQSKMQEKANDGLRVALSAGTFYKLIIDFLFTMILLWLLKPLIIRIAKTIDTSYLKNAGLGFAVLMLTPLLGVLLLVIIWLGVSIFLLYGLLILLSLGLMKLLIGWKVLSWWNERNKKEYSMDWKAALLGVLLVFILGFIPVFGWLVIFFIFLSSLGGLTFELFNYIMHQKNAVVITKKKK